jgi:putative sterol carrier protein
VPETFLSSAWFDEVEKLRAEQPAADASMSDLTLNIVVTGGPEGDAEVHVKNGNFERGLVDDAPTKLTVPYDVAKAIFIEGNQQAGMQAFMSGQIKVEGDMSKLMAMQGGGGAPSAEQQAFQQKLKDLTA